MNLYFFQQGLIKLINKDIKRLFCLFIKESWKKVSCFQKKLCYSYFHFVTMIALPNKHIFNVHNAFLDFILIKYK